MSKFLSALELGIEILSDMLSLANGSGASFSFSWRGKKYTVTIAQ